MMATAHSRSRGFSLIELMMVVGIMGVLAGVAGPSLLKMVRQMELSSEARILYSALVETRGKAIATGVQHSLFLDRDNQRWEIRAAAATGESKKVHSLTSGVEFGPDTGYGATFPTPYDTIATNAWCSWCGGNTGQVTFDSDGTVTNVNAGSISLVLTRGNAAYDSGGSIYGILFIGPTGDIKLYRR